MHWQDFVKQYVWNDTTTPYLVPAAKLNRLQADKELFAYAVFVGSVFAIVTFYLIALVSLRGNPLYHLGAAYTLSVAGAAAHFGYTKHQGSAAYLLGAPLAALAGFGTGILNPNLQWMETLGLCAFCLLWARYGLRVRAIAKVYRGLPPAPPPEQSPPRTSPRMPPPPPPPKADNPE